MAGETGQKKCKRTVASFFFLEKKRKKNSTIMPNKSTTRTNQTSYSISDDHNNVFSVRYLTLFSYRIVLPFSG